MGVFNLYYIFDFHKEVYILSKLYIAEKPSVALSLAKALNCTTRKDGYFEGNDNIVTFAVGHVLKLKDCVDYDPTMEKWSLDKFPFIPNKFEYKISENTRKQFNVIKSLVNRNDVTEIISAFDDDREGEVIYATIEKYLNIKKPCYRLLLNEWTPIAIKSALGKLKPISEMRNRQSAGLCRQATDWLLGVNYTSVSTLKFVSGRSEHPLSIGRIVLPTLKLIYDRDMEINRFIPQEYYELKANFQTSKGNYDGLLLNRENSTRYSVSRDIELITKEIEKKRCFCAR